MNGGGAEGEHPRTSLTRMRRPTNAPELAKCQRNISPRLSDQPLKGFSAEGLWWELISAPATPDRKAVQLPHCLWCRLWRRAPHRPPVLYPAFTLLTFLIVPSAAPAREWTFPAVVLPARYLSRRVGVDRLRLAQPAA